MSARGRIVIATPAHAREVAARMRTLDCQEIREQLKLPPETYALRSLEASMFAWAGLVDDRPICLFGLMARSIISDRAVPWIFTTPDVERYPKIFWRGSLEVVARMRGLYPKIEGVCDSRFEATVRWLTRLGFKISPEVHLIEGVPFHQFEMSRHA